MYVSYVFVLLLKCYCCILRVIFHTIGSYTKLLSALNPLLLPTDAHNVKNAELLKHSKLDKNAPTCFGLHRNHLQGAKVSAWLHTVHDTHALQVTICSHSTDDALHIFYADAVNQTCNF